MDNYKIINNEITSGFEDNAAKKIKVTEQNFMEMTSAQSEFALEEMRNKLDEEIAQQEARVASLKEEIASVEDETPINFFGTVNPQNEVIEPVEDVKEEEPVEVAPFFTSVLNEETEEKPEIEEEPEVEDEMASAIEADLENIKPFGYYYEKPVQDISQDQIDSIKEDLGNSYKGRNMDQNLSRLIDNVPAQKEDVENITIDSLNKELNKTSYLDKTKQFKDIVKSDLEAINNEISANTENLNQHKHSIKTSEDEKKELTQVLVNYLEEINSTNELELKYMEESANTNQKAKEAIQAVGLYYNDLREKAQAMQDEIREKTHQIDVLKNAEKEAIDLGVALKEKLDNFIKEKYEALVKVNERDENSRRDDEEITEITGIKEETPIVMATEEAQPLVSEMPQPVEQAPIEEEPKRVIDIQSFEKEMIERQRGLAA